MDLLERIAASNGDPQKTIAALRLVNQRLKRELAQYAEQLEPVQPSALRNRKGYRDKKLRSGAMSAERDQLL